ncbi:MAG: peptide-methionine (S)-S-oxide reductase MsrA [Alphaproteobacteria bacterium]
MTLIEHLEKASSPHFILPGSIVHEHQDMAVFGMGCFWGAERIFWQTKGVLATAVGYAGGTSTNIDYHLVCTGTTGHAEVVLVNFDPDVVSFDSLLSIFFENHDPTQGHRQGNDRGSQYRSAIMPTQEQQRKEALTARAAYDDAYQQKGYPPITTDILDEGPLILAETYHQQYLAKNPRGYCGIAPTGVKL